MREAFICDSSHWYLCEDGTFQYVVGRGSWDAFDWFVNFGRWSLLVAIGAVIIGRPPIVPRRLGPFAHPVHAGYWHIVEHIWPKLSPMLKSDRRLVLTGHSKGGGEMRVLSAKLIEQGYQVDSVITFGEPAVLSPRLVDVVHDRVNYHNARYVNCMDVVPRITPMSEWFGYLAHGGDLRYFDRRGNLMTDTTYTWRWLDRVIACLRGKHSAFLDHQMAIYRTLVKSIEKGEMK